MGNDTRTGQVRAAVATVTQGAHRHVGRSERLSVRRGLGHGPRSGRGTL